MVSRLFWLGFSILLLSGSLANADAPAAGTKSVGSWPQEQTRIRLLDVATKLPDTGWDFLKESFSRDSLPGWAAVLGSTAVLYHYDSDIYEGAMHDGQRWGLSNEDHTKTVLSLGNIDLLRLPSDTESFLYFMGDGWTDFLIAGGFLADGAISGDVRPYNTALEMVHGMAVAAVVDQALKRSFGRQSPNQRTEPRGKWTPFPNTNTYNHNTSKFDAMPSGHVMTSTVVFTVMRANYPEYDNYLMPLEFTWLTVLGFAMLNNGVHWASDYPLGFAIGYMVAKSTVKINKPSAPPEPKTAWNQWHLFPGSSYDGTTTLNAVRYF